MPHILQTTPASFSRRGVIGGGERIALGIDAAIIRAGEADGLPVTATLLALDGENTTGGARDRAATLRGTAWDATSLDAAALVARIEAADIVYVHQCLTEVGLFVAAHASLLGRRVIGMDAGGGPAPILSTAPDAARVFDALHALSEFGTTAFAGLARPVHVIAGPVDTIRHRPPPGSRGDAGAPAAHVLVVGRVLPHKGIDRVIRALPPHMRLTVAGEHYDTSYLGFLRALAADRPVTFRDALDDDRLAPLWDEADILVQASTHLDHTGHFHPKPELLGLAALEALARGIPALVSDAGSLPELATLPGCTVFRSDHELAALLASARIPTAEARAATHAAVDARFGPLAAGRAILALLLGEAGGPCASSR